MSNIILLPLRSFYSKEAYREAGFRRTDTGLLYLFVLIAFCWSLQTLKMIPGIGEFKRIVTIDILPQIPTIVLKDGVVHADVAQPYYIYYQKTNQVIAIIDTTGKYTASNPSQAPIILTKTQLFYTKDSTETRIINIQKGTNFEITQKMLHVLLNWLVIASVPFILIFMTVFAFAWRTVQALFYSLIGLIITKIIKLPFLFKSILRLSVLAITPSILIRTILDIAGIKVPYSNLAFLLVTMSYLVYGLLSCKGQEA